MMRTTSLGIVSVSLFSLLIVSCSGGPDDKVSDDVFLQALRDSYVDRKACSQIGTRPRDGVIAQAPSIRPNPQLDALVEQGLLTRRQDGIGLNYSLTDAIRPYLKNGQSSEGAPNLCFADIEVTGIIGFTEPTETFGSTVSNVRFITALTDIEPWAADVFAGTDYLPWIQGEPREVATDMVLTSGGWIPQSELQQ
ncbi:hypothetical protein GCM10007853_17460 [Algimonas ampicilliniresistens]|uniref:Lipoprotein n=1 Tax=Algimonas ampicilliniresistens TaxID=1298735 RepID=A0ABQ5VBU9_9PROT|nr:hypothetical protein [Algimonas ampicilliniresistens]GLQ23872.1 hypothetical protein GCM10007853_17460 [Algimonas ampicilliniresistens]